MDSAILNVGLKLATKFKIILQRITRIKVYNDIFPAILTFGVMEVNMVYPIYAYTTINQKEFR